MYVATGGPNVKWGVTDFKWGALLPPPRWRRPCTNHLNVLYNKLIRPMNFASNRSHVTPLYHQSNLLKINDFYHLEIAKMMHCLHNGKLPQTFDYFVPVNSVHTHLTRKATHGKYFLHSIPSEHGKRSIRYHGPNIWDSVDDTLQRLSSILFKKRYRAHLISEYAEEDTAFQIDVQINILPFFLSNV